MTMGRIDHQAIHTRVNQFLSAFTKITSRANSGGDTKPAQVVFRRRGILDGLLNVFDGDQTFDAFVIVDDEQLFDAMFLQDCLCLLEGCAKRNIDERLHCHDFGNGYVEPRFESQIAIRNNADEVACFIDHGYAADVISLHYLQSFAHRPLWPNRYRIHNHARFGAFDFVDLFSLPFDTQISVDDPDASLLRERDGQRCFRNSVHGGGAEGNLQPDVASELS